MSDRLSTDEIEREIEMERASLARTLNELQRQVAPEAIVNRVSAAVRSSGGDVAGTALRQAQENPLALAVTGAGLAWLMAGPKIGSRDRGSSSPRVGASRVAMDRRPQPKVTGFRKEPSSQSFDARMRQIDEDSYDPSVRTTSKTGSGKQGEKTMRDRLIEGTESMTEAARDRVMAAREAAILAERRIELRAREYGAAGKDAFNNQPLMGALVAFGVGALAGALLPRTSTEDRHLGAARDRAVMHADRVYRSEAARLRAQAESIAEDTMASIGDAVSGETNNRKTSEG